MAPADLSTPATIVVWSVKPQVLKAVAQVEAHHFNEDALHLSIAAGVPTVSIADWVQNQRVVRAMPNTPAMVGQGATGLFATDAVDAADRDKVTALLRHTGLCLWVEQEHLLEAVTAVSGSGPAYMFYILDAMVKGGVCIRSHGIGCQRARDGHHDRGGRLGATVIRNTRHLEAKRDI